MKKVLIAITTLTGGGAERVASVWANQLVDAGYDVSMLVYGRCPNEYYVSDKIKIYTVASTYEEYKSFGYFKRLFKMRKLVKEAAPDVVISFLQRMQVWMMMSTFGMKLHRVETIRVSPWHINIRKKSEQKLWMRCFEKADAVIFQTAEQAEFFNERIQKKGVVISNPISAQYKDNPKVEYSERTLNFVAAGRITDQKNYPLMIEAFSEALKEYPHITLSIYGAGDEKYTAGLQKLIDDKGASESIKLMGRTTDMLSVLKGADAFVMTSNFEGMPNALAEAMVMGLPCISTNCRTGPRDMIDNGKCGYLVEVGNKDEIASAIKSIAAMDSNAAREMGTLARNKILDLCSEENSLKKLTEIIENSR